MDRNKSRRKYAAEALEAYRKDHSDPEDKEANIIDLMTDLLHLHASIPRLFRPEQIADMAKNHYEAEAKGQEAGKCPVCGSEAGMDYGDQTSEDNSLGYRFVCADCGTEGIEWHDLTFSEFQVDVKGKKGKPVPEPKVHPHVIEVLRDACAEYESLADSLRKSSDPEEAELLNANLDRAAAIAKAIEALE